MMTVWYAVKVRAGELPTRAYLSLERAKEWVEKNQTEWKGTWRESNSHGLVYLYEKPYADAFMGETSSHYIIPLMVE